MSNDAELARLIRDGKIFLRPYGAPPLVGPSYTPTANDTEIGYYSDDGFELTPAPGDTESYTGHNGDEIESNQSDGNWTVGFDGLETKKGVVDAYFETNVNTDDGSYEVTTAAANRRYNLVCFGLSKNDGVIATEYPNVSISDRDPIVFNRSTLQAYGMTFQTRKDPVRGIHFKSWDSLLATGDMVPAISVVRPAGRGEDEIVTIHGSGFTAAEDVAFGASSATDFHVVSDSLIAATLPAGSAGNVNVTVTTPVGTSDPLQYART